VTVDSEAGLVVSWLFSFEFVGDGVVPPPACSRSGLAGSIEDDEDDDENEFETSSFNAFLLKEFLWSPYNNVPQF
jgi:hypothetical protein